MENSHFPLGWESEPGVIFTVGQPETYLNPLRKKVLGREIYVPRKIDRIFALKKEEGRSEDCVT